MIGLKNILGFLWLVLSWKWEQNSGKLGVTGKVLTILDDLLHRLWFGFLGQWPQNLWVRVPAIVC